MSARLHPHRLSTLPAAVQRPSYQPADHGTGIVHVGLGAFHRAHQAVYLDEVLARRGGDWRITGISCRSAAVRAQLEPQSGLYTVAVKSPAGCQYRVIGSIASALVAPEDPAAAIAALAADGARIITLTITEKGYQPGPELPRGQAAPAAAPGSAIGLLAHAMLLRFRADRGAPTLMSCDNLRDNGQVLRRVLLEHARALDPALPDWLERHARFPCTMVDRIVPATTTADLDAAQAALGLRDEGLVCTEQFTQWVIEDDFATERPELELAGAQLVRDVRPFEVAKLRLLNGSHSTLAYVGNQLGHTFVHEAIADPQLSALIAHLMQRELAPTLTAAAGLDPADYQHALLRRFANPSLQHRLRQIAMDGSQKLPQRLLAPLRERLKRQQPADSLLFAVAAWMRHVVGRDESGSAYEVDDPLAAQLAGITQAAGNDVSGLVYGLLGIEAIFGDDLRHDVAVHRTLTAHLEVMLQQGMRPALGRLLARGNAGGPD